MSLKIAVLAKQAPDTRNVGKDAMKADGTINRAALPAIFNPEDLNALEQALRLKDEHPGSTVTILTMGPGRAAEVIREGLYRGADNGYLLTDRAFAGADTLATSYALATAIKKIGDYDVIIGGRQAIDGDTAQVGPQVAEKLGLTQVTYAEEILNVDKAAKKITVKRHIDGGVETVEAPLPIVITVNGSAAPCRPRNAKLVQKYKRALGAQEKAAITKEGAELAYAGLYEKYPYLNITEWSVADVNGDGKNEVVVLGEKRLYVYQWQNERLVQLGEYKIPTRMMPLALRSIDLNRDRAEEIILTAYEEEYTQPYSMVLSFKGNTFTEVAERLPYYLNVVRVPPDYMPTLIGQKGDPSRIFSRGGVYEMMKQGNSLVQSKKLDLPSGVNALNFAWLPGTPGKETEKLVVLTDEERLRVFSDKGSQLNQTDEKFSGSAIGIAEQTQMPGMGKDNILIPSKYFVPLRMIPSDLEQDGSWELLVNKPISVSAQFFENYRFFPEGEIESLYWDGVCRGLQWMTRRIKGSVVDFALADPNNDGTKDLVVCLNTHPGALGLQNRKTVVVFYPLDLSMMDPKTAPALD